MSLMVDRRDGGVLMGQNIVNGVQDGRNRFTRTTRNEELKSW
jgi:hypothetical protein